MKISENSPLAQLMSHFPFEGNVVWIGLRPGREIPVLSVDSAWASPGNGLDGDRFTGNADSPRQVTLIQAEHLQVLAAMMKMKHLDPSILRRNIVVEGINLLAIKDKTFTIGSAVLEVTGFCHPCSKMETALGPGGYNAMRGHGGVTAKVITEGTISVGDPVFCSGT